LFSSPHDARLLETMGDQKSLHKLQ
jgi:hypothetical protein